MSADPLLPIAPARVKALVLPVGPVKRQRFVGFLERLTAEHVVQLRDISPDSRPNRNMFSPLAFPDGAIFYELATHNPPPTHLALSPFDLFREPLVVLALADGSEIDSAAFLKRHSGGGRSNAERNIRALYQELETLRDQYPKALVHRMVLFDYDGRAVDSIPIPEGITTIPPLEQCVRTTMRTVMCDVSSMLLAEMTALAKSFEAMSYIDSPGQTSGAWQPNGAAWAGDEPASHSRRNSQFSLPTNTRSSSAAAADRVHQSRMSMPGPLKGLPFGSSSSTPARSSTPTVDEGVATPDMSTSDPPTPDVGYPARPGTAEGFRTLSQDRVSVKGFGPGGLNDRWRSKGRCRVTIVIGSLYLHAGRWPDALKELIDGATVAKSINDHIWHGKALELIVICLLLLGWAGIEFQVPTICLPPAEKTSSAAAAVAAAMAQDAAGKADPSQPRWLRNLQVVLPELLDRTLALYSRISAEHLPPLPLAEATIRFSKILATLHITEGQLTVKTIEHLVTGNPPSKVLTSSPRLTVSPSRTQIASMLFKAFPNGGTELLSTVDRVGILTGIASVLGVMGYQRKKAMVIRELVSVLMGGLVEARTRGAAEVGIHPAAGLAALNGVNGQTTGAAALDLAEGDVEHGIEAFLGLLLRTYGVVGFDMTAMMAPEKGQPPIDDSDFSAVARIQRQAAARFFGMPSLKLNILRACINFSEALPDFAGVLKYSGDLLRTAGSGLAPGPRREDAAPIVARDEQIRLVTNILKTSGLSQRLGMGELDGEFWDEFFLRGVKLEPLPPARTTIEHKKSELAGASTARSSQDLDPLIYNPFLKPADKTSVEHTLVAGEPATFKLTLQNPYEFEVEIESVRLDTEGVDFDSAVESAIIGPYRTQLLRVTGTPRGAGSLHITGAVIKVRGCRERRFPIFPQPWSPEQDPKIKAIGLAALEHHVKLLPASVASTGPPPKAEHVSLNVIDQQPLVVVKSTTLPQSSVMVLEGERQLFSITLQNLSKTTPADFLLFSFRDSTQEPLQAALGRRDATPQELYEYELILARRQALRQPKSASGQNRRFIEPGETATFDFEILGKPGLTNAAIQVDYACLGVPPEEVAPRFFTRQVMLQLTVTVNASVEVYRMDVLPLPEGIPRPLWKRSRLGGHGGGSAEPETEMEEGGGQPSHFSPDEYCLLLLDLRNAWPSYMHVDLATDDGVLVEETILPGNTMRVMVPLKRIYIENPHAPIPVLNPARQRQFVVSTSNISPGTERSNREAFWYREKILDLLHGSWRTTSGAVKSGAIELRSMRLTPRMIEAVKVDEVEIEITVVQGGQEDGAAPATTGGKKKKTKQKRSGENGTNVIFVDEFARVAVHITNRTADPIYPTVRLMPELCHRPLNVALDFTRKLAWNGTLQRALPLLPGGSATAEFSVGVTPLCRGEFEIAASVEETRLWQPGQQEEPAGDEGRRKKTEASSAAARTNKTRPRSDTQTLMDALLGPKERRIWHSRRPCCVVVRDRD